MRMDGQEESSNVEDARGSSGGGGGGFRLGGGHIGLGTVAIALVAGWIFGINPLTVLGLLSGGGGSPVAQSAPGPVTKPPAGDPQDKFVSQVLRSTEVVWTDVFRAAGKTYQNPKLTLYRGSFPTGCGQAVVVGVLAIEPHDPAEEELTRAVVEHADPRRVEHEHTRCWLSMCTER